jgi:hypothetical protein
MATCSARSTYLQTSSHPIGMLTTSASADAFEHSCIELYTRIWEAIEWLVLNDRDAQVLREIVSLEVQLAIDTCNRGLSLYGIEPQRLQPVTDLLSKILTLLTESQDPCFFCEAQNALFDAVYELAIVSPEARCA